MSRTIEFEEHGLSLHTFSPGAGWVCAQLRKHDTVILEATETSIEDSNLTARDRAIGALSLKLTALLSTVIAHIGES